MLSDRSRATLITSLRWDSSVPQVVIAFSSNIVGTFNPAEWWGAVKGHDNVYYDMVFNEANITYNVLTIPIAMGAKAIERVWTIAYTGTSISIDPFFLEVPTEGELLAKDQLTTDIILNAFWLDPNYVVEPDWVWRIEYLESGQSYRIIRAARTYYTSPPLIGYVGCCCTPRTLYNMPNQPASKGKSLA